VHVLLHTTPQHYSHPDTDSCVKTQSDGTRDRTHNF
jgi:hypothetical protein